MEVGPTRTGERPHDGDGPATKTGRAACRTARWRKPRGKAASAPDRLATATIVATIACNSTSMRSTSSTT
eukprot:8040057-Lingulodinium_polyedra.AAC.1